MRAIRMKNGRLSGRFDANVEPGGSAVRDFVSVPGTHDDSHDLDVVAPDLNWLVLGIAALGLDFDHVPAFAVESLERD